MLPPRENLPSMLRAGWTEVDGLASTLLGAWTGQFVELQPPVVGPSGLSGVSNIGTSSGRQSPRRTS
jgi:hypothetical protein